MEKNGEFVPTRLEDVLVKAIGKPEHSGRTRGVGNNVGLQTYFGKPTNRGSNKRLYTDDELWLLVENVKRETKEEVKRETMEEMYAMMEKKWEEMTGKMSLLNGNNEDAFKDPSPRRPDQSSCHSTHIPIDPFNEVKESTFCRLAALLDGEFVIVADGMVFPWVEGKMVHNTRLTRENAQVSIDNVIRADVPLPLPWNGFTMVDDAEGSFAQWPKSLIILEEKEVNVQIFGCYFCFTADIHG
ncbi:hypothetical protein vseg_021019 [Gypsophila vaccaria]